MQIDDGRFQPQQAPVVSNTHNMPFARRSINAVLFLIFFLAVSGTIMFLAVFADEETLQEEDDANMRVVAEYRGDASDENEIVVFFEDLFDLDGADPIGEPNMAESVSARTTAVVEIQYYYDQFQDFEDGYRFSVQDILGSEVLGREGEIAGSVHDILVNRETGAAKAIIVNDEGAYYDRDLNVLTFEYVLKQEADGDTLVTVTEDVLDLAPEFYYEVIKDDIHVSLRHLRDGQILDHNGNVAGHIDAVIYRNAEAQRVFFTLKPSMVPANRSANYALPFEGVHIFENPDGYDIRLSETQTEALAHMLYGQTQ